MPDQPSPSSVARSVARARRAGDFLYLWHVADGKVDLLDPGIGGKLEAIFPRVPPGTLMAALFERACNTYARAVASAAYACLAREVCRAASDGTLGVLSRHIRAGLDAADSPLLPPP